LFEHDLCTNHKPFHLHNDVICFGAGEIKKLFAVEMSGITRGAALWEVAISRIVQTQFDLMWIVLDILAGSDIFRSILFAFVLGWVGGYKCSRN
jgi:hypothetical protein